MFRATRATLKQQLSLFVERVGGDKQRLKRLKKGRIMNYKTHAHAHTHMREHAGGHGTREGVGMSGDLFATTFISPCNDHPQQSTALELMKNVPLHFRALQIPF